MSYDVYWVKNRAEKIADFEHPTLQGALFTIFVYPGRCPGLGANWAFSPHCLSFDTPACLYFYQSFTFSTMYDSLLGTPVHSMPSAKSMAQLVLSRKDDRLVSQVA